MTTCKKILLDELDEQSHPERVEDVIFWALEHYANSEPKGTWGRTIAYAIKERILAVADAIEKESIEGLGFNMAATIDEVGGYYASNGKKDCGTIACIAGFARVLEALENNELEETPMVELLDVTIRAEKWLGLTEINAFNLFYGWNSRTQFSQISPTQACETLRNLAKTGVVKWS